MPGPSLGDTCVTEAAVPPLPGVRSQGRASPPPPEVAGVLPKLQWRSRTGGGVAQGRGEPESPAV